jgi:multidrug resistance efflux pump
LKKNQNIEIYNEEVQEIMKDIPGSLLRWGLSIIFLIFASIIVGSYFFTFSEVVSAPLIITTTNPPAPLICKSSGRITTWFASDGEIVKKGDVIALINNTARLEDIMYLEEALYVHDTIGRIIINSGEVFRENLSLGDLQEPYNTFCLNLRNYDDFKENNFLPRKIDLSKQQLEMQEQQFQLSLVQQQMMKQELEISKKGLERFVGLLGKGGVSEAQVEEARGRYIQSERGYTNFLASLKSAEINLISMKRSLLELQEQNHKETGQFRQSVSDSRSALKSKLKEWKERYLIASPVDGRVTLTRFWSENHVITAGERLATIVPEDSSQVICRAIIPSSGIGKVETGQTVHVKLSGYPYMEHGMLMGKVSAISLVPEEKGYIVEITLKEGMVSNYREQLKLVQEMEGTAEIITKKMRMIYRFINPLKMIIKE